MRTRRALLALGLGGLGLAPAARAFRLEPLEGEAAAAWAEGAACPRSALHDELRAELVALSAGDPPPEPAAVARRAVCPFCRCTITLDAPAGS